MSDPIGDLIYDTLVADKPRNGFMDPLDAASQGNIHAWTDAIGPQIAAVVPVIPPWQAVTAFTNAWVNYGGVSEPARYRKLPTGQVVLGGRIKSGALGSGAFTLPSGYWPAYAVRFAVASADAFGEVVISTAGVVTPTAGDIGAFQLDGISFFTD